MAEVAAPAAGQPAGTVVPDAGAPSAKWRESFEDVDIKGATSLDKFVGKDDRELLGSIAKSYVNLEKMPRGVTAPKDGAPQAEWDAFYEKLGRPKTVDEYGIELKVPENVPWNKDAEKVMLANAHKHGLSKRQAEGLLNDYLRLSADGNMHIAQRKALAYDESEATMKQEWGGLADRNVALVQRAVTEFGDGDFKQWLDDTGMGNDPRFLRFVHKMAMPMLEDGLIKGEALGMKQAEAQAEIDKIMRTKEWQNGDKAMVARIAELYPIAHAGEE